MRSNRVLRFTVAALLAATVVQRGLLRADEPTTDAAVRQALANRVELKYIDEPLEQVAADLHAKLGIPLCIDSKAFTGAGISADTPVTFAISDVSTKAAIGMMLASLNLTTVVRNGVLTITTPEQGENIVDARIYDVADLLLPASTAKGSPTSIN
jgi:hypothetical protein